MTSKLMFVPDVDTLANIIRSIDGNHSLGAGALAEAIIAAIDTPSVLRWELNETVGYYVLKVGRKIIGHVQPLVEGFWVSSPCEKGLCTHNSEHEARRAAEKALGLPIVEEV